MGEGEKWRQRAAAAAGCYSFYSKTIRSSTRSITTARNDGNSAYCRGTIASCRPRRNYARRPSRDGDNSLFRLRSLIERPPPLSYLPLLPRFLPVSGSSNIPRDYSVLYARHNIRGALRGGFHQELGNAVYERVALTLSDTLSRLPSIQVAQITRIETMEM